MISKSLIRQALQLALLLILVAPQYLYAFAVNSNNAKNASLASIEVEPLLEYHFHPYFNVDDPVQVAHAIELRNEIIANCASKKIIAIPHGYHYNPENPVFEFKLF